jgi:hypothetical protein
VLPDGRKLVTSRDAIAYLSKIIPKAEHNMREVQVAAHCLTQAAEPGRPGLVRAHRCHAPLNRRHVREFDPK